MLRYTRSTAEGVNRRYALLEVFRHTVADIRRQKAEDSDSIGWDLLAPKGGIYLLNALESEHLKHQEDLQLQFAELAEQFRPLLEASLEAGCELPAGPHRWPPHYRLLLHHLRCCKVQDVEEDPEQGGVCGTFFPLKEFLLSNGTTRFCGGLVLLPADREIRRRSIKNRLLALLITIVKICGPVLLLIHSLQDEEVHNKYVKGLPRRFATLSSAWHEFACIESVQKATITILGAFLLTVFIEIAHSYSHQQCRNSSKERFMPCDNFWVNLGEYTNMWCIFWSVIAMPFLFLEETSAKDVLYDSLGMLFLFTLDDFCGGALDYLALNDEGFQRMSCWTMGALIQCPRKISDIVNPKAMELDDIFQISLGPYGLKVASGPGAGLLCKTRLMEEPKEDDEKAPLQASNPISSFLYAQGRKLPFVAQSFQYCVYHRGGPDGEPIVEHLDMSNSAQKVLAWKALSTMLIVAEVVIPGLFAFVHNPCPH